MQGTQVWLLLREDSTRHRATKPMSHNCWAGTLEFLCSQEKPLQGEAHARSLSTIREQPLFTAARKSRCTAMKSLSARTKTQYSQNILLKVSILPKAKYGFNEISIKIPMTFLMTEIVKPILKSIMESQGISDSQNNLEQTKREDPPTLADFKTYKKATVIRT